MPISQVTLWENLWNDEYVKSYRMFDRWATDTLPLAGEYFRQTTKKLMWDNQLYKGSFNVGGRTADIAKSQCLSCMWWRNTTYHSL